jgi:hypothetical protein
MNDDQHRLDMLVYAVMGAIAVVTVIGLNVWLFY